jgi:hypothetical protein
MAAAAGASAALAVRPSAGEAAMNGYELRYLEDGLLIASGGPWAWFRLPTHSYEVLSENQRLAELVAQERLLSGLRDLEAHLLVLPRTLPVSSWAAGLDRATTRPAPGWPAYLERTIAHLRGQRFRQREVYLGLRLVKERRRPWLARLVAGPERLIGLDDPRPDGRDLDGLRRELELTLPRVTAASPGARPATAAELRWLVRRASWRGLLEDAEVQGPPARPAWGGETLALIEGVVRNGHRSLRLGGDAGGIGHLATLAVAHMPDRLAFPGGAEWLHHHDLLDFPVEASVRFRVVSPREAARDLGRQVAAALDQAEHVARTSADLPLDVQEVYEDARQLERRVLKDQQPLVYCWPRLLVAGASEEQMVARVTELVENHRDLGIELVRPSGDQLALFLEAMPGDRVRVRAYEQRMEPVTLAGAMYGASAELGDGRGCYVGQTTGQSRVAVTLDVLLAALRNRPTAVSITGAPGSGKTNTALLLAYQARLRGAWVVIVDPKAEATGLTRLEGLGAVQTLRLDHTYEGLLDPFRIEDDGAEASLLAAELCRVFLPPRLAQEVEGNLLTAAAEEAAQAERPSLLGLLGRLEASGSELALEAAAPLRAMASMPMARMCFAGEEVAKLRLQDALTVIQFAGLSLPPAGSRPEDWSIPERLAVGLMRAVTALAGRLIDSGTTSQPKLLVLDEAWALTASAEGQRLVERLARTGRSRNAALLLATQNARDLMDERVTNCLGVKLGFRSEDEAELRAMLALLDVEPSAELMAQVSRFAPGECLMRDLEGRVGRLQVELVPDELRAAFDTTPRQAEPAAREEVLSDAG